MAWECIMRQLSWITYRLAEAMGESLSTPKERQVAVRGYTVVCDDCGSMFYIYHDIISGRDSKKRCSRYSVNTRSIIILCLHTQNYVYETTYYYAIGAVQLWVKRELEEMPTHERYYYNTVAFMIIDKSIMFKIANFQCLQCATCQSLFCVSRNISDQPQSHETNCLR